MYNESIIKPKSFFAKLSKIISGQKASSHQFKISTLKYQQLNNFKTVECSSSNLIPAKLVLNSRDHLKNEDCSTSYLMLAKFDLFTNKRPLEFSNQIYQVIKATYSKYQSRDYFKNMGSSTSNLSFVKIVLLTK